MKKFESREDFDRLVPYAMLGAMKLSEHNYEDALTHFEEALIRKPDDLSIMAGMIVSYWAIEKFDKALKMSERMIQCAPTYYDGYRRKGISLVYLGTLKEAITSYNEDLKYTAKRSPEQETVFVLMSNARLLTGDWDGALSDTESALKIEPESSAATINKCIALKKLDRAEEAKQILQEVLTTVKDKYYRAGAFAVLGDKENMLKELAVAIEEDSSDKVNAKSDPDFADYREDTDFRKLVYEVKE